MGSGSGGDWQRYFRTGSDLIERASAPTVDEDVGLPGTNRGKPASFLTHSNIRWPDNLNHRVAWRSN